VNQPNLHKLLIVACCTLYLAGCGSSSVESIPDTNLPPPNDNPPPSSAVKAFPGAEGFGANSLGGRGGQVIYVTSLEDSGSGTLREAIRTSGPRIVVFGVGGTIDLLSPLIIESPFVTIAGQTAPGGIQIRNGGPLSHAAIQIRTNDVVIRYLRVRPGPSQITGGAPALGGIYIQQTNSFNIMLDHVSIQWAEDKAIVIFSGARDISVQWSILAETLYCANHEKSYGAGGACPTGGTPHSRGITISTDPSDIDPSPDRISFHHNLMAHFNKRYPSVTSDTFVDVVNNVMYNIGEFGSNVAPKAVDLGWVPKMNYRNNTVKSGPNTQSGIYVLTSNANSPDGSSQIFIDGNAIIGPIIDIAPPDFTTRNLIVNQPHPSEVITTQSAGQSYDDVLSTAGANLPSRDSVDQRIVAEAMLGGGTYIDDPSEVGGWPMLGGVSADPDSDLDGMPDAWETQNGLNPDIDDSASDSDQDGYTNIEEFLNMTKP